MAFKLVFTTDAGTPAKSPTDFETAIINSSGEVYEPHLHGSAYSWVKNVTIGGGGVSDPLTIGVINITDHIAVDGVNLTPSGIQYVDVQLSNSQIKNLRATPITLIPAPGAGYMLVPHGYSHELYDVTEAAYGVVNATAQVGLDQEDPGPLNSIWFTLDGDSLIDSGLVAVSSHNMETGIQPFSDNRASNYDNWGLVIRGVDIAEFTDGDPANTISFRIWYSIVPTLPFGA